MDLGQRKLLIVDDVRFTRLTLVRMLRAMGEPAVFEAGDGEEALALLEGEAAGADCVITDLEMPRLDGLGLLRKIREGSGSIPRDTRVVLLTGHSELDRVAAALQLQLDAFLAKPVSRDALEACLLRLFDPASRDAVSPGRALQKTAPASARADERAIAIPDVPDGAVLSRDLLLGNGRLLLRAGSALDPRTRDRLSELLEISGLPAEVWIRTAG